MCEYNGYRTPPKGFSTASIHAFQEPDQWESQAVVAPMTASATFKIYGPNEPKNYIYSRDGNPSRDILENTLATLENGKYGLCFSSGLGTITAILNLFKSGDHFICGEQIYQGTNDLFKQHCPKFGIQLSFVSENKIEEAIRPNTKLIWLESLTNPTIEVTNIQSIAKIARKHNILFGIDNTFLTPYFLRPLDLGADFVMHSLTKYINGHTDVVMGAFATNQEDLYTKLKHLQICLGIVPAPFDCYQVTRSIKTLAIRMQQHMKNSLAVAKFLEKHQKVDKVLHPGLPSHPQYELLKKQASGWSGMMSFYIKGGLQESQKFLKELKVVQLATSLGGVESLAGLPYLMSHGSASEESKQHLRITNNLIRLSVGIEDTDDILQDLDQALAKI